MSEELDSEGRQSGSELGWRLGRGGGVGGCLLKRSIGDYVSTGRKWAWAPGGIRRVVECQRSTWDTWGIWFVMYNGRICYRCTTLDWTGRTTIQLVQIVITNRNDQR